MSRYRLGAFKNLLLLLLIVLLGLLLAPGVPSPQADTLPAAQGQLTSIVPPPPQVVDRLLAEGESLPPLAQLKARPSPVEPKPLQANVNLLVIMVDFSDNPATVTDLVNTFDDLIFDAPQPTGRGSVRDYYSKVSYGNVDLVTVNLPSATGWQTAPQTYAYYVNNYYGWGAYPQNAGRMVEDVLPLIDPVVDFSNYDNDGDGRVDTLLVVHAGTGAEFSASTADIWSHASSISGMGGTVLPYDGVMVDNYVTVPEGWDFLTPGLITPNLTDMTIGVICHEIAHGLWGMPDLYDVDGSSYGIGQWGLMSYGDWNGPAKWNPYLGYNVTDGSSPALPTAWSRLVMGFDTYVMPMSTTPVVQTLLPAETAQGQIVRLKSLPLQAQESFLLENRWTLNGGYDEYLPGDGLLIWHVDEAMWAVFGGTDNDSECTTIPHCSGACALSHYLVALEQADGADHLENFVNVGDTGDPFPGSTNRTFWRPYTTVPVNPESGTWYDSACSTSSCIDVTNISANPSPPHNVNFTINQSACTPAEADLGDAPDSQNSHSLPMTAYWPIGPFPYVQANYPTVYWGGAPVTSGPRHHFAFSPFADSYLGNVSTPEQNADFGPDVIDIVNNITPTLDIADQDSIATALGRDDGVGVPVSLTHCSPVSLPYTVTVNTPIVYGPMPRLVNVWFDWNRDGDWADTPTCPDGTPTPEWAVQDQVLWLGPGVFQRLSPPFVPQVTIAEDTPFESWMRISLSEMPAPAPHDGRGPSVGYDLGETEDYFLVLEPWLEKNLMHPGEPLPGEQVVYQILYNGFGNVSALGTIISDVLPPGLDYFDSFPPGSYDPGSRTVSWTVDVVPNQPQFVDLIVTVSGAPSDTLTNTAHLIWGDAIWKRASASVHVGCPPDDPQAAFGWTLPACVDQTVSFTDLSTSSLPLSYTWDLDSDGLTDSTEANPTWQYAAPGSYTVSLTVSNTCGADGAQDTITVLPNPVASFEQSHTSAWITQTISFTDTSQGNPAAWTWDFDGDGLIDSTQPTATWQYASPGPYSISLTVTNLCSQDAATGTITILGPDYGVELLPATASASGSPGETVTYTLTARNLGNLSDTLDLSYTDLSGWTGGLTPASVQLSPDDSAPVTVTVEIPLDANDGDWDAATLTATSQEDPSVSDSSRLTTTAALTPTCQPVTAVSLTQVTTGTIYTDTLVSFSADISPDDFTPPYTYTVDYDDGTAPLTATHTADPLTDPLDHVFATTGAHNVLIAVWNCAMQASDAVTATLAVEVSPQPVPCNRITAVDFGWSPASPTTTDTVTLTGTVTPPTATTPIDYGWDFGDGGTASGQVVYHNFGLSATYTVWLSVSNPCSSQTISHRLTVTGEPFTPTYGVELTPAAASASGSPGDTLSYPLSVRNTGDTADTVDLAYTDLNGWTAGLTPAWLNLLPDATAQISVTVQIPSGASDGAWDAATVTATSQGDPALSASSRLTTTALVSACVEVSGVELARLTGGTLHIGDTVQFNADLTPDDFSPPYTYTVDYGDGTTPTTASGSDDPLLFSHAFAASGTFTVGIAAWNCTMEESQAVTDALQLTIVESGYRIYLPVVIKGS